MDKKYVYIDGQAVELEGEKNLLALVCKAGIDLPTFCYYPELSVYGACRMCIVEMEGGKMEAACSTVPRDGMKFSTNTPRLRSYRKMILELLLSNHCGDCTSCPKNRSCKLQEFAQRYGVQTGRFPNPQTKPAIENSSLSIVRDTSKCILCGACVRACNEIQNVGAIHYAGRGSKMRISTAFGVPMSETECVGCGQCAAVCPVGAITVKQDIDPVWKEISKPDTLLIAQIAPAVRVAIAKEFGLDPQEDSIGRIAAALRKIGFDLVFDTSVTADLTILEESAEFVNRLQSGGKLPLFTSCCPGWIKYAETKHPELMGNISTCRSPMQMFSPILKEYYGKGEKKPVVVAIMPCTAKKMEAARDEFRTEAGPDTDYVLTTQELISMIRQSGICFDKLAPEAMDTPFDVYTGGGVIFGATGGVTEAVIRHVSGDQNVQFTPARGLEGVKEMSVPLGDKELKIAVVSGLMHAEELIQSIKNGAHYDFVEVMACPGGCISGGGQPQTDCDKPVRMTALYKADEDNALHAAGENPILKKIYEEVVKDKVHEMLHVHYHHE